MRLDAEVLALERDVALLRTKHATSVMVTDYDVRLRDLHARLNACLKQLAHCNGSWTYPPIARSASKPSK